LRIASIWKTNAIISMPDPATSQAIIAPRIPASSANHLGRENTPSPTIEPTTVAVMVTNVSLCAGEGPAAGARSVTGVTVATLPRMLRGSSLLWTRQRLLAAESDPTPCQPAVDHRDA